MDMSGKFRIAGEAGPDNGAIEIARALAELADHSDGDPLVAVAWRDGKAITVDLSLPLPRESRPIWPEHIAIAALFLSTYALAVNQLHF